MAKLILKMIVSRDGFVARSGGETDWMGDFSDEELEAWELATLWNAQAHLMGSRTFKDMKAYWPESAESYAEPMNVIPKVTFSRKGLASATTTKSLEQAIKSRDEAGRNAPRSPHAATWDNPEIFAGSLQDGIKTLKAREGKPMLVHGGAGFARSLIATGEIDEFRLLTCPIVLGEGMGIFDGVSEAFALDVVARASFPKGACATIYHPRS